jgi:hypothetical protein
MPAMSMKTGKNSAGDKSLNKQEKQTLSRMDLYSPERGLSGSGNACIFATKKVSRGALQIHS